MAEITLNNETDNQPTFSKIIGKVIGVNKTCDIGCLLVEDCSSFQDLKEKDILETTKKNVSLLFKELFELRRS